MNLQKQWKARNIYLFRPLSRDDLNRQIIRSGSCEVFIRDLELILPPANRCQLTMSKASAIASLSFMADPKWNLRTYTRMSDHNIALGLVGVDEVVRENTR